MDKGLLFMHVYSLLFDIACSCSLTFVCMLSIFLSGHSKKRRVQSPQISQSCIDQVNYVCEVYLQVLSIMGNVSSDILIGFGCNQAVVYKMWCFFREITKLNIKMIVGMESGLVSILSLFCQMMLYILV